MCATINAIPGRNLLVLNFAHHLPKPWTDRFAHVNGKQPGFLGNTGRSYVARENNTSQTFDWLITVFNPMNGHPHDTQGEKLLDHVPLY